METETNPSIVRNLTRGAVVTAGLAMGALASPAVAAPPTTWEDPDNGSILDMLLLLVGAPLAVIAVIVLLTYLPSMIGSRSTGSSVAFQEKPEWFGGPRQGTEAAAETTTDDRQETDRGGASARW